MNTKRALFAGTASVLYLLTALSYRCAFAQEAQGCLWGLFQSNLPIELEAINETEIMTGKKAGMIMFFVDWTYDFPSEDCDKIVKYGAIPHVTWEPWINWGKKPLSPEEISRGKYDKYVRKWAKAAREFKYPFFLRFGHEMNGDWYPWSAAKNKYKAAVYVDMYRHVHDIFKEEGADNVIWLWCPMNADFPTSPWNKCSKYYPGGEYVDWIGMDAYNWGRDLAGGVWIPFSRLVNTRYNEFVQSYPGKPIMLGEFGSGTGGGDKAVWIQEALGAIKKDYPAIKAAVWFNIKKERDWRIQSSTAAVAAFAGEMKDGYFLSDPEAVSAIIKDFKLPTGAEKELKPIIIKWEKPVVLSKYASVPPVIDGKIDNGEWTAPSGADGAFLAVVMNDKKQVTLNSENISWSGEKDLNGNAVLAWDEKNLYLLAEILDDKTCINSYSGDSIWNGDSLEIAFGLDPAADPARKVFSSSDFQLAFLINSFFPKNLQTWSWQLKSSAADVTYVVNENKKGDGYILEASVPWRAFKEFSPSENMLLPFNMALNDADKKGGNRQVQMVWAGNSRFYTDPSMWGWIKLVK
ncbi:MAG: sugar-binding protein [Elusimicrobiota bacterium]